MKVPDPSPPPSATPPTDFFAALEALPRWQSSLLAHLDSIQAVDRLKQPLESGDKLQLCLIRDGGAKDDLESFGWGLHLRLDEGLCGPARDPFLDWNQAPTELNHAARHPQSSCPQWISVIVIELGCKLQRKMARHF